MVYELVNNAKNTKWKCLPSCWKDSSGRASILCLQERKGSLGIGVFARGAHSMILNRLRNSLEGDLRSNY